MGARVARICPDPGVQSGGDSLDGESVNRHVVGLDGKVAVDVAYDCFRSAGAAGAGIDPGLGAQEGEALGDGDGFVVESRGNHDGIAGRGGSDSALDRGERVCAERGGRSRTVGIDAERVAGPVVIHIDGGGSDPALEAFEG